MEDNFNVLVERGLDSRRVVIDEAAPIYHICEGSSFPPMQIIVAEHDMRNRAEQNALLISTLKHFGCEDDKIDYRVIPGCKHIQYLNMFNSDGSNVFADMVYEFIDKIQQKNRA